MKYDKAVVNGRFSIPHCGHMENIRVATSVAKKVYVLIGSANAFPNMVNPFRPHEREDMLRLSIKEYGIDMSRIYFRYIDDCNYRNARWETDIRDAVDENIGDRITMVGFKKDRGSWWLDTFGWDLTEVEGQYNDGQVVSSTKIRDDFFNRDLDMKAISSYKNGLVCPSVLSYLESYKTKKKEEYNRIADERLYNIKELKKMENYPYRQSLNCCTGDAVVVCNGHLLVTVRGNLPGLGAYALPGGHKDENETFKECAIRELREEVRLKVPEKVIRGSVKEIKMFDYPGRSYPLCKPTQAVYIELMSDSDNKLPAIKPRDEVRDVLWMPLHMVRRNRSKFFDDHFEIVQFFCGI